MLDVINSKHFIYPYIAHKYIPFMISTNKYFISISRFDNAAKKSKAKLVPFN